MMRLPPIVLVLLLLPLTAVAAEDGKKIYRSVDEDGNVTYSDRPPSDDAEPVELDPLTTVPAAATDRRRDEDGEDEEPAHPGYQGLEIVYPTADEAIRHNGGQVPFRLELRPEGVELDEQHRVEILLDGSVRGSDNALTITVGPVDRGPHEVSARVVDAGGNVLAQSQSVNFFLLRHSVQP